MQKMAKTIGFLLKLSRRDTTIVNCQLSIVNCQFGEAAKFQFFVLPGEICIIPWFSEREWR